MYFIINFVVPICLSKKVNINPEISDSVIKMYFATHNLGEKFGNCMFCLVFLVKKNSIL